MSLLSGLLARRRLLNAADLGDRFVPHIVPRDDFSCEERWSEWQDLNLRPPRPERGSGPAEFASAQYGVERGYIAQLILARKRLIFSTTRYASAPGRTAPFDYLNR